MSSHPRIKKIVVRRPGTRKGVELSVIKVGGTLPTGLQRGFLCGYATAEGYIPDEWVTKRIWKSEPYYACTECGRFNDDGEGWNYRCGNCADRAKGRK